MEDLKELASEMLKQFEVKYVKRAGELEKSEIVVCKTDKARDLACYAHDQLFPNDWIYETMYRALEAVSEDGEEAYLEPDVYTYELLRWLRDYPHAISYVDDELERGGGKDGLISCLMAAQAAAMEDIKQRCISWMVERQN